MSFLGRKYEQIQFLPSSKSLSEVLAVFQESYPNWSCFSRRKSAGLDLHNIPAMFLFFKLLLQLFFVKTVWCTFDELFLLLIHGKFRNAATLHVSKGRCLIDALITQRSDGRSDVNKMILIDASGGLRAC